MKRVLSVALALHLALAASAVAAQSFGEPFPVTNTRYGPAFGKPRLATNGTDFFLFWAADRKTRATRIRSEVSAGHVIFDTNREFDIAWTGKRFLAAAWNEGTLTGRVLDEGARPIGDAFVLSEDATPARIVAGSTTTALLYYDEVEGSRLLVYDADGNRTQNKYLPFYIEEVHAIGRNGDGFVIVTYTDFLSELRAWILDANGQVLSDRRLTWISEAIEELALANDGARSLLVWRGATRIGTVPVEEDGRFGATLLINETPSHPRSPQALWTGAHWTVSYEDGQGAQSRAHIAHIDWSAHGVLAREESEAGHATPSIARIGDQIMAAWSATTTGAPASIVELPLETNEPRPATYAAAEQSLMTTIASQEAALIVWRETSGGKTTSIRAGMRFHDGRWTERQLVADADRVFGASNGHEFALIVKRANVKDELLLIDEEGHQTGTPIQLALRARDVIASGNRWVLLDENSTSRVRLLNAAGEITASVIIGDGNFAMQTLASDGDGFLAVGHTLVCGWGCSVSGVGARRLTSDLRRADTVTLLLSQQAPKSLAGVKWNGSDYVTVWIADRVFMALVDAEVTGGFELRSTAASLHPAEFTASEDGSIAFIEQLANQPARVVFLDSDADVIGTFEDDANERIGATRIEALPDSSFAYVASSVQNDAPQHGASHVMMTIARPSPVPPPDAPSVVVNESGAFLVVQWIAPAGTINGYRIEYRIDEGSWNELDEWFRPGVKQTTVRPPDGAKFAVRMRAFNDGGASEYSRVATTQHSRRRAVR